MKITLFIMLLLYSHLVGAQLNEEFSDGEFSSNPSWSGSNAGTDFTIVNNRLRSNSGIASSSFFLSTASTRSMNTQWEFWINIQFNPSGSNYVDVYLNSDKADLKSSSINGYFIRIGGTDDEISLFKRSGAASGSVKLIDGLNGVLNTSNNTLKIKLSRNNAGLFTLERETEGSSSGFYTEGTAIDTSFLSSAYFGIFIQQSTSTFFQKHFFDNFRITPLTQDIQAPGFKDITVLNEQSIELNFSEAMDSISVKNPSGFRLSNYHGIISSVSTTSDPATFRLQLSAPLNTGNYTLKSLQAKDRAGNLIGFKDSISFSYLKPYSAKNGDIIINEIFADPSPQIDLPSVEFVELYNTSKQSISLKNWKISDPGSTSILAEIVMLPESYLILCAKTDTTEFKKFGNVLGVSPWPSLNNSGDQIILKNHMNQSIDSLWYTDQWHRESTKRSGGWTLEKADPKSVCTGIFNWYSSVDSSGGSPGRVNSVYAPGYDQMELKADSLTINSDSTLTLHFNKYLNATSLKSENFQISTGLHIKELKNIPELRKCTLTFNTKFLPGTSYQIIIKNLRDCSGNILQNSSSLNFKIPELPKPLPEKADTAKIYITEFFADPSPEIGLPLVEFIEIFNPANDTTNLNNWSISDPQTKSVLKKAILPPKEYLILCPIADTLQYKSFGKVLGLNPWPSLNNNSDQISLKSFKGRTVDSIAYTSEWYNDEAKKLGGWTLERIDYQSKCTGILNWKASINPVGGTPGKINSLHISNYDSIPFHADSISLTSDSTLTVYFNKPPDNSALSAEQFKLTAEEAYTIKSISKISRLGLSIGLKEKFKAGSDFRLSLQALRDCSGKLISGKSEFHFRMPDAPKPASERIDTAKIYITEIFADPSPEIGLPLVEFIEIFNPGNDTIDLNNWSISDSQTKSSFKKALLPPKEYLILCPLADTLQYNSFGKVLGLNPWPSLNNNSDQIVLKSFKGRTTDSISYAPAWYKDPVKKSGGWTLERSTLSENACQQFYNWKASSHPKGGTPGRANLSSQLTKLLKIEDIQLISDSSIHIAFSTIPDTNYLKIENFSISNPLLKPFKLIIDPDYQKISLTFKEKFKEGIRYELSADSLLSCSGQHIKGTDARARFEIPHIAEKEYPLLITEIMADPSPVKGLPDAEYVELFNPTDKAINLKGLKFGRAYTFGEAELNAGSFLILCADSDTSKFKKFGTVTGIKSWESLNNSGDILILRNNKGREILKVEYKQSWYKNPEKQKGGHSLELMDISSICSGIQNWAASLDSLGGSPGRSNSHLQSPLANEPLKLTEIELIDSLSVIITFNKAIDSLKASNPESYSLNNGVGKASHVLPLGPDFTKVKIGFNAELSRGLNYSIKVENVCDCRNRVINSEFNNLEFFYPKKIEKNDILITEILFNPRPGGSDFVEIYNNTNHPVDLKELSLGKSSGDNLSTVSNISSMQKLLNPGKYLALSSDPENIRKEYYLENPEQILKMTSFPAFNDDSGTAILFSNDKTIDKLSYLEKMHFPLLKNVEGISLERRKLNQSAEEPGNLRSATTASGGATPGAQNSQYTDELTDTEAFKLTSKTFSPDNDGFEDFMEMSYRFAEPGNIANVSIFNDTGQLIKRILKNHILNANGTFQWDGFDEYSQAARIGIYILHAEIFNTEGAVKTFKRSFALVRKL